MSQLKLRALVKEINWRGSIFNRQDKLAVGRRSIDLQGLQGS